MFARAHQVRLTVPAIALIPALVIIQITFAQITPSHLIGRALNDPGDPRYASLDDAIKTFYNGDLNRTRQLMAEARDRSPDLPPVSVMLAQLLFSVNQVPSARAELERAVMEHPDDPEAYLLFGDLALRDGRLTDAELLYQRGNERCETYTASAPRKQKLQVRAWAGLTTVAVARNDWRSAERYATQWLALDPESAQAHTQMGRASFYRQQYQSALDAFKTAYQLNSSLPRPEVSMALLYEELVERGDVAKRASARKAMQSAVKSDPDNSATLLAAARWALTACEIEMAETNVKAVLAIDQNLFEAQLLRGLVARHRKDHAAAEGAFRAAHLEAPTNAEVFGQLVLVLLEQPDAHKQQLALEYAQLNLRANPDQTQQTGRDAAITLAWVLFRMGRPADALPTIQGVIRAGSVSEESAYLAAKVLSETDQKSLAVQLLDAALKSHRCFPLRKDAETLRATLKADRPE